MKKLIIYILFLCSLAYSSEFIFISADSDTVAYNIGSIQFWGDSGVVIFDTDTSALDTGRWIIPNWLAFLDSTHRGLFFINLLSPTHFYLDTTDTNIYIRQAGLDSIYLNELDDIAHLPYDAHYPMDLVWRSDTDSSWEYVRFGEFLDSVEVNIDGGDFWQKKRGRGLYKTTGDTIILDLQASSGLILRNSGIAMGTPGSLSNLTTNSVTGSTHTHAVSGFLTGNQTITLSGDVGGSGTTSITATIADNSVDGTDIAFGSDAQGDVYYYNGTDVARLGYGTAGYFLKTMGASQNPTWGAEVGDIEGVTAGAGLSGTSTSGTATIVVNAGLGIQTTNDSVAVKLRTDSGLAKLEAGLALGTPGSLTGATTNAVTGSSHTHSVGSLTATNLSDEGDFYAKIRGRGLYKTAGDSIIIDRQTNSGLSLLVSGLALGTPTTLTAATTNAVTGSSHTHAVTGFLTGNQTITLSGDVTGSGATAITTTVADNSVDGTDIAIGSDAQGDIMYYDGTNWARLGQSTSGYLLKTQGAAANPAWANITDYESALEGVLDRSDLQGTQSSTTISDMEEYVEDYVGGMVTGNTETGIAVTYEDSDGTLDFVISETGDISAVTAGAGMTGGGTTGAVTLDVIASTGLATTADSVKVNLAASSGLLSKIAGLSLDGTDARNYNWTNETHNLLTTGSITSGSGGHIVTGVGTWTGSTLKRSADNAASYILGGTAWDQGSGLEYHGGEHLTTPGRVKIWYGSQVDDLTATDFYLARKDNGAEIDVLRADINGDITIYDALTTSGQIRAGTIGAGTTWNGNSISSAYLNITADKGLRNNSGYLDFLINSTNFEWNNLAPSTYELRLKAAGIDTNKVIDAQFQKYIRDRVLAGLYNDVTVDAMGLYLDGSDDATLGDYTGVGYPVVMKFPHSVITNAMGNFHIPFNYSANSDLSIAIKYLLEESPDANEGMSFRIMWYVCDLNTSCYFLHTDTIEISNLGGKGTGILYTLQTNAYVLDYTLSPGGVVGFMVQRQTDDSDDDYAHYIEVVGVSLIYKMNDPGSTSDPY